MQINKLEDLPWYHGLHGEVDTCDCYRVRELDWQPDVVFDLGANVGTFTRLARSVFPRAKIISVEPHPENFALLTRFTPPHNVVFLNKAIGNSTLWRTIGAANGGGESYISICTGFNEKEMVVDGRMVKSDTQTVMIHELVDEYLQNGQRSILKLDIEGNENCIWDSPQSMAALAKIDYISAELHRYTLTTNSREEMLSLTEKALGILSKTHTCESDRVTLWATKIQPRGANV